MILIKRPHTDPFFNLAAEEYFLKNSREDVVMLWQSNPAVVVGKHQNTVAEVNIPFVYSQKIPVIRRISGGGTVFHGQGNLNFSHIQTSVAQNRLIDFKNFTKPVITFLKEYGIKADFEGKNNLRIEGKKFSGNSAHAYKNRIIHHGTLLFNTDLDLLEQVIKPPRASISGKSIPSVRASVTNLAPFLKKINDFQDFKNTFENFIKEYFGIRKTITITQEDEHAIQKLVTEKYKTVQWNYGYSPAYRFEKSEDTAYGRLEVQLKVNKGVISDIQLLFEGKRLENTENRLKGKWHEPATLQGELADNKLGETILQVLF